jgi:hypothetical protein
MLNACDDILWTPVHLAATITPAMRLFVSGILHCRKAVIAMLRLKKPINFGM